MLQESKKDKLVKFKCWIDKLNNDTESNYQISIRSKALKHLEVQIMNPINMKKIKQNIEYIIKDPLNLNKQAPNNWHRYSYDQIDNETIYTMDINGRDRLAYIILNDIIIFSLIEHP